MSMRWPQWLRDELNEASKIKPEEPEKARAMVSAAFRRWVAELVEAGLCRQGCGEPAAGGTTLCEKHRIKVVFKRTEQIKRMVERGICDRCCKNPATNGRKCDDCRKIARGQEKRRYDDKKKNKICVQCRQAPSPRFAMCRECREVSRESALNRSRDLRKKGICVSCGERETGGKRLCAICGARHNRRRKEKRSEEG